MATTAEILNYIRPQGGWVIYGEDISTMIYDKGVDPVTQKEFDDAVDLVDAKILADQTAKDEAKSALLERLGITASEAALLLS
jgi:hypothetical protein